MNDVFGKQYEYNSSAGLWCRDGYVGTAYNDGDPVEENLKSTIASTVDRSVLSTELRAHIDDWPTLYHLSSSRANLLRPFEKELAGASVLEIGAGCGAITRYLGEVGANVLALEGSIRRAEIARIRCAELQNVTVVAEVFEELDISAKFDFVTMIGVLEYAGVYGEGDDPAKNMLNRVRSMLKPRGRLILAIENKLGLKYFAGAPEDHAGLPMYGIEGRYRQGQPKTYGRKELADLLGQSGYESIQFMAPFPDYKLPASIITEKAFSEPDFDAAAFAWQSVRRDPQLPQLLAFSPELVWPAVFENGLGFEMANSFLVTTSPERITPLNEQALAWHYSTDRKPEYCKETLFTKGGEIPVAVTCRFLARVSSALSDEAVVRFMPEMVSTYTPGETLAKEFIRVVAKDGWTYDELSELFKRYLDILLDISGLYKSGFCKQGLGGAVLPGIFMDALPQNIIVARDGGYKFIDTEWQSAKPVPLVYVLFRSIMWLLGGLSRVGRQSESACPPQKGKIVEEVFKRLGFSGKINDVNEYIQRELQVQEEITGRSVGECMRQWQTSSLLQQNVFMALDQRDKQLANMTKRIEAMEASLSWRITEPLRRMFGAALGLQQALDNARRFMRNKWSP